MQRNLQIILTATTASILTFAATAQENNTPQSYRPAIGSDRANRQQPGLLHSSAKAKDIIGMTVKNYQDDKIGSVEDLAVDMESGRIVQVILSTGGFVGMGDRLTAVPPGSLHHDAANKLLHLDADKEKLKNAPEFKTAKWTEYSDAEHLSGVYTYFGQESAFSFLDKDESTHGSAKTPTVRNADGSMKNDRMTGDIQWKIPGSRLGQTQKASKLIGMTVKNQRDEAIGIVDNMQIDVQSGRILAVVVSSGGFLGIGDELSAVPPTALSFNAGRDTLLLDTTKDMMGAAPHFKPDQWPDFNEPTYSDRVYRAYKQEPYFTTNEVTDADNSGRNVRDRNDRTLTSFDQGNSQADTDATAQIRKGILDVKDLSVKAKNVKIITNNGRVTLRGPVASADEKRLIGEIADRIAGTGNVDNQLEATNETPRN